MGLGVPTLMVGALQTHLPPRSSDVDWDGVACAIVMEADGRTGMARAMLRLSGAAPVETDEELRRRVREARRRERNDQHERASRLLTLDRDPEPNATIERMMREAEHMRATARAMLAAGIRGAAAVTRRARAIEAEAADARLAQLDRAWINRGLRETKALAAERGETVEPKVFEIPTLARGSFGELLRYKSGPNRGKLKVEIERRACHVILEHRPGLEVAYERGHLHLGGKPKGRQAEVAAADGARRVYISGLLYAESYEIAAGKRSARGEGGGGGYGPKGPQVKFVEAGETLAIMREGLEVRQQRALDLVCGQGLHLREAARAMDCHFTTAQRAVVTGLRSAEKSLDAARKAGRLGAAAAQAVAADKAIGAIYL